MAQERHFCGNCGTPLVVQDGKIVCPNCGTEYAVDWGHEDVARAEAETAQERTQAQLDRERVISETREQITRQQTYNSRRRERARTEQGIENWLIKTGILVGSLIMLMYMGRACSFLISKNYGSLSNALFGEEATKETQAPNDITQTKIDGELLLNNEDFLRTAYESQVYVINNLTPREIIPDGTDTKLVYTGNFEYEQGYIVYTDSGRTELFEIFALEYVPESSVENAGVNGSDADVENGSENASENTGDTGGENDGSGSTNVDSAAPVTIYIPVYLGMNGVRVDGKIACYFEAHQYKGTLGQKGFSDKDTIIEIYTDSWENITETVPFDIPENIRSEVMAAYGKEGTT